MARLAVAGLAGLAYANTLDHGLVWDDPISIRRWLPALPRVTDAFFPPSGIPQFPTGYYRPLQLLSYRFDNFVGDGASWAFHLSVVVWHVLATVLVLQAALRLFAREQGREWAALAAAVVFAVHPIHTESVAWMAARPDVMVAGFGLAALLAQTRRGWSEVRRAGVAATLVLAALLCKENAAALLVLVPASVCVVASGSGDRRGRAVSQPLTVSAPTFVCFAIASAAYLSLRAVGLESVFGAEGFDFPAETPVLLLGAIGAYLRMLALPVAHNAYLADVPIDGGALAASVAALALLAAIAARAYRRGDTAVLYALAWLGLTLAPSLAALGKSTTAPLAERYLYVPSIGFCWLVGLGVCRFAMRQPWRRWVASGGIAAVVALALVATMQRNRVWRDNVRLWAATAAENPRDGFALRNLASSTIDAGDTEAAEQMFLEAAKMRNDVRGRFVIYNNLGTIALRRGDDEAAERHYRRAISEQAAPDGVFNLGVIALRRSADADLDPSSRDRYLREARGLFEQAVTGSPFDPDMHVALAQTAESLDDMRTAREHYEAALSLGLSRTRSAAVRQRLAHLE